MVGVIRILYAAECWLAATLLTFSYYKGMI